MIRGFAEHGLDDHAQTAIWNEYLPRVRGVARRAFPPQARPVFDEDDVAISVFRNAFDYLGTEQDKVKDRASLLRLLRFLVARKLVTLFRRSTAVRRYPRDGFLPMAMIEHVLSDDRGCDELELDDWLDCMFAGFDDEIRQVIAMRIEGYLVTEIADAIGIPKRSVERKLNMIRNRLRSDSLVQSILAQCDEVDRL